MISQEQQCHKQCSSEQRNLGASAAVAETHSLLALLSQTELPSHLLSQVSQQFERLEGQIQAQAQMIDQLRQESRTDSLTGLPNRRAYSEKLSAEWTRAMRTRQPLALISIDVDHFKQYNDSYGHDRGDWCLQQVAEAISQSVQRGGDLVCRVGGEEFVVVVPAATAQDAAALAEKIRLNLAARALQHERNVGGIVTLSMGVAHTVPSSDQTPDDLYRLVDQALYRAKQQGRNQISLAETCGALTRRELAAPAQVQKRWNFGLPNCNRPLSLVALGRATEPLAPGPNLALSRVSQTGSSCSSQPIRERAQTALHQSRTAFTRARQHCLNRMSSLSAEASWRILGLLDN